MIKKFVDLDLLKEKVSKEGKLILRPSSIQQFLGCSSQWFRSSLLEDFQRPAAAANAGTALHAAAEVGYNEKIAVGALSPLSALTDVAVEEWKKMNQENDLEFSEGESYHTYEKDLVTGITEYYPVMEITDVIATEKRYDITVTDHPVFKGVGGTIDLILDNGIADIKFTKRKTTVEKYLLQQSTYTLLRERHSETVNSNVIHNVIRSKNVEILPLRINTKYAEYVIRQILATVKAFWDTGEESLFRGTNSSAYFLCSESWCGYWTKCPHVSHLKGFK